MRKLSFGSSGAVVALAFAGALPTLGACGSGSGGRPGSGQNVTPLTGKTDFVSAPLGGLGSSRSSASGAGSGSSGGSFGTANASAPAAPGAPSTTRTVQETDLYRLEGNRLYYLNAYRGLMVFDVTNVDKPKFLGRSAIYGSPVDMIVRNGIATVVVGDWYGTLEDGSPFRGSIVRGLDATDPSHIKVIGEAKLGGWVQDDRVVGDVLYAVSYDYGWSYGWGEGVASSAGPGTSTGPNVIVSSVNFAGGKVKAVGAPHKYNGYGGAFNVTQNAIMLAHADTPAMTSSGTYVAPTQTDLQYLDISDPGGQIVERGTLTVNGVIEAYGADNGRWSLDFDGTTAHVIGCDIGQYGCGGTNGSYVLATADFSKPASPALDSELHIASTGWSVTARFNSGRMYLSPAYTYYTPSGQPAPTTPLQVYDLSNPYAPVLAGQTQLPGGVQLMIPSGNQLFALGTDSSANSYRMALNYVDVTNPASPSLIGTSSFGEGWTSTPATGTFKAFTFDANRRGTNQGLVVLPFSGWDGATGAYNNGVQLIEFTPTSITTAGAAHTHGWVERGIFVNGRIVSLSNVALSVVDYADPVKPKVTAELTLARNVITTQPGGTTIAEVSTDWWDNDVSHSEVRVLPIADAEENADESAALNTSIDGVDANVFTNGNLEYIVTNVQVEVPCGQSNGRGVPTGAPLGGGIPAGPQKCIGWQQQVQVVDLSNGGAKLRGKISLPMDSNNYYGGWGWYGCYEYDWFDGAGVVQVGSNVLAFRRWHPNYNGNGAWDSAASDLFVVDLSNPDRPSIASTVITNDATSWWGDMRVVDNVLYTSHYEWTFSAPSASDEAGTIDDSGIAVAVPIDAAQRAMSGGDSQTAAPIDASVATLVSPGTTSSGDAGAASGTLRTLDFASQPTARYYVDRIDLSDPKHPKIGSKINVPGVIVGGSPTDASILYTIDYSWDNATARDWLDVVKVSGNLAYLQSSTPLDGYVGKVIVRGTKAYMTSQIYYDRVGAGQPSMVLHEVDLSDPVHPVDRVSSGKHGWGWLLDVIGNRAMVTSGWGGDGLDVYRVSDSAPPAFDQFIRTRGWSLNSLSRQNNQLFLSSGYWGVQAVTLQ